MDAQDGAHGLQVFAKRHRKAPQEHHVTEKEVMECFANGEAIYFTDDREEPDGWPEEE